MRNFKTIVAGTALIGAAWLAACGGTTTVIRSAPKPAVTVTAPAPKSKPKPRPKPTVTVTAPAAPGVIINNNPPPAAPAPPVAAPALADCGTGMNGEQVYAGAGTSCPFALNVESDYVQGGYWYQAGTSQFDSYSPVTGLTYLMTSSSIGNPVVVTGGNGAFDVQFNY
jgi:hypothetical protein